MTKLRNAEAAFISLDQDGNDNDISKNPWRYTWKKDKDSKGPQLDFLKMIKRCRFYYNRDPVTSTTINKLIDIGINDLTFYKNGLSSNEFKIFEGIKPKLLGFAEDMALEYLLSGLVVPEVEYGIMEKEEYLNYLYAKLREYKQAIVDLEKHIQNIKKQ